MYIEQRSYSKDVGWSDQSVNDTVQLVLAFAAPSLVKEPSSYHSLKKFYPNADIILTSTAGEIRDVEVNDNTIVANALTFEKTPIKVITQDVDGIERSLSVGEELAKKINDTELKYTLVLSDGLGVNGDQLLLGIKNILSEKVEIFGGIAGDGSDIVKTHVSLNGVPTENNTAVLVGFYGESINISSAAVGGWDTFGIKRKVTKSKGNVVFTLDDKPILELYKEYLGDNAEGLPSSGIMFPIGVYKEKPEYLITRTLFSINKDDGSMAFTGDVHEGYNAFLMKTTFSKLVEGAAKAADFSLAKNKSPVFALLISCLGRRAILQQRTEDEVDAVRAVIGYDFPMGGFYSYGEIGSTGDTSDCQFQNQTMAIALFSEK